MNSFEQCATFKGVISPILAMVSTFVLKYTGKSIGITVSIVVSLVQGVFILAWTPNKDQAYVIFLMVMGFAFTQPNSVSQVRGIILVSDHLQKNNSLTHLV